MNTKWKCEGTMEETDCTTASAGPDFSRLIPLSVREKQVLSWTARGKTAAQVGQLLFLSERTISFHVSRAIAKLGASNKTEAVAIAVRAGFIE